MRGKQHNPNDDTRAEVHLMTSRGATQSMAADALGIEEKCLWRHYQDELDGGAVQADMAIFHEVFVGIPGSSGVAAIIVGTFIPGNRVAVEHVPVEMAGKSELLTQ